MADLSIRQIVGCIRGQSAQQGRVSLLRDYFGYTSVPRDSDVRAEEISVKRQAWRVRGPHFHLKLILVAWDAMADAEQTDRAYDNNIAYARRLFGDAGLGIGRVARHRYLQADCQGLERPQSSSEAEDVWEDLPHPPGRGLSVFVVLSYMDDGNAKGGRSPCPGDCGDEGLIVVANGGAANLVHEIGHFFGLEHHQDPSKLDDPMFQGAGGRATSRFDDDQRQIIHGHTSCLWPGCQ